MRRKLEILLPIALIAEALSGQARAVVVLPKGSDKPVMGYLVRQDERTVVLRQADNGSKGREQSFARGDLDELILTVSPERLTALNPSKLEMYLEYAEELAEKQRDPEARDAAIRLYAICAARGDDSLRHSALLGLIALARSPQEERRFRAAAHLYDPTQDASVLHATGAASAATATNEPADDAELAKALRLFRQGRTTAAKALLDRPAVQASAAKLSPLLSLEELQAATAAKLLTDLQLKKLIQAELALETRSSAEPTSASATTEPLKWSQVKKAGLTPLSVLSLDKLTEFDPTEYVYRDGKWTRP